MRRLSGHSAPGDADGPHPCTVWFWASGVQNSTVGKCVGESDVSLPHQNIMDLLHADEWHDESQAFLLM